MNILKHIETYLNENNKTYESYMYLIDKKMIPCNYELKNIPKELHTFEMIKKILINMRKTGSIFSEIVDEFITKNIREDLITDEYFIFIHKLLYSSGDGKFCEITFDNGFYTYLLYHVPKKYITDKLCIEFV